MPTLLRRRHDVSVGIMCSRTARAADRRSSGSMAALGLGVDVRVVAKAGERVTTTVGPSLVGLGAISVLLLLLLKIA